MLYHVRANMPQAPDNLYAAVYLDVQLLHRLLMYCVSFVLEGEAETIKPVRMARVCRMRSAAYPASNDSMDNR